MATTQLKLNVSYLQATCNFIVALFSDAVAGGMTPFDAFDRYMNQLQGLLLLAGYTSDESESIVLAAQDCLRAEYHKVLNGSVSPNASAVQEVA